MATTAARTSTAVSSAAGESSFLGFNFRVFPERDRTKLRRQELIYILQNLETLLENGVSLPKSLATISREESLQKHRTMLDRIRRKIEAGEPLSEALEEFPQAFGRLMVNQIRVGERSGTLVETLGQINEQLATANALRSSIAKKLSYPLLLVVMGTAVVAFMLIYVVPVFEQTYADAGIPLPGVTQALIAVGDFAASYYWIGLLAIFGAILLAGPLRRNPAAALKTDQVLLRLPLVGPWVRDLAVLRLMEVLGNLMESGYRLAEALEVCSDAVGNRVVRQTAIELKAAVNRGERFSRELERHGDIFPPLVGQLVIIGEQTGNLIKATSDIRKHLRREIERKTGAMVATIEPVLTIGLAAAIGMILLAIYLPMFDMINAVTQ